jgi:hypothetical protein
MIDDLHHNMNLVIPGLNFWGDQNDAAKSVVDKTKWVMQTAIDRIEKLEAALRELSTDWDCCNVSKAMRAIARQALEIEDDPQTNL